MPNPPITEIVEQLYLGDSTSSRDAKILGEHNITAVVSLSGGKWVHWSQPWYTACVQRLKPGREAWHPKVDLLVARACALAPERYGAPFNKPSWLSTDQYVVGLVELVRNALLNELFALRNRVRGHAAQRQYEAWLSSRVRVLG